MQWPENYPPETSLDHAILKDKSQGKYPVSGYGWTLADKREWLTQEKIDNGPDLQPTKKWYIRPLAILLGSFFGFATFYILWQAIKLIIFYYGQHAINSAIRG